MDPDQMQMNDPAQDATDALEEVAQHEWAGDLYEEGDQSDPAEAFARFRGASGESAWLDRAPDGTLTGWIQDADGSIYRYTDADAFAVDVDHAEMEPVADDEGVGDVLEDEANETGAPASAPGSAAPATMPDAPADDEDAEDDEEGDDGPIYEDAPADVDDTETEPADEPDGDVDEDDEDDEEDEEARKKRLGVFATIEGKSFTLPSNRTVIIHLGDRRG